MRVRIAHKLLTSLFTLLILSASSTTNIPVSVGSSLIQGLKQQQLNAPRYRENGQESAQDRPLSPRLAALQDRLKSGTRLSILLCGIRSFADGSLVTR